MTNNIEEQLSALVDGEIPHQELPALLGHIQSEPALRQRWGRYNLISDALHKNLPSRFNHDLHVRVTRAMETEPVVLAPPSLPRRLQPWAKQAVGIAIAASVTAVAILGFQTLHAPDAVTTGSDTVAAAATEPKATPVDPELDPYLVNHNEHAVSAGVHGVLPYVRLVSDGESE